MRKFAYWLAFVFVAFASHATALEVGAIQVRSHLNEPLVATIAVRVANIQERNSLAATLAADTEYVARGLQPLTSADDLIVQVTEGGGLEQMLIELRSLSDINEPFMSLVLQLVWDGGSEVKEFTVLLDPAPAEAETTEAEAAPVDEPMGLAPAEPQANTGDAALRALAAEFGNEPGVSVSGPKPQVVIRKVHPDTYLGGTPDPAAGVPTASFSGDSYGPVAAGETLWRIASKVRPDSSVSMAQVMAAIHEANPSAFSGGYATLKKGAMLSIPDAQTMRAAAGEEPSTITETVARSPESESPEVEDIEESPTDGSPGIWMSQDQRSGAVDSQQREKKEGLITKSAVPPILDADEKSAEEATAEPAAEVVEDEAVSEAQALQETEIVEDPGRVDYQQDSESETETTETTENAEADAVIAEVAKGMPEEDLDAPETGEREAADESASQPLLTEEPESAGAAGGGNTRLLAGVILIVLIITYLLFRRRRAKTETVAVPAYAMPEDDVADEDGPLQDGLNATVLQDDSGDTVVEESVVDDSVADSQTDTATQSLDVDEALAQADTYLSYGLYESAAEALEKGIAKEPQSSELRMKLLETHDAAGNGDQFVAAVEDWQSSGPVIDDATQARISSMAQRVAPAAALFAAAAIVEPIVEEEAEVAEEAAPDDVVDEASEVEEELPLPDFDLDQPSEPAPELTESAPEAAQESEADSVALNLNLSDLDVPLGEDETDIDEEIEDLDLPDEAGLSLTETHEEPIPSAEEPSSLEFDLGELDLDVESDEASLETPSEEVAAVPADSQTSSDGLELAVEEHDEPATESEAEAVPDDSEYDVKIDLAQAYIDMGEPDLAKGLLDEVLDGGNDAQKAAAQNLMGSLD